jgi:predicted RNase H-like HicB family nuclease
MNLEFLPEAQHTETMKSKARTFNLVIEKDRDGYFVASVPELRGCHTQAKSLDVLLQRTREAIELCLEVEEDLPEPSEFIGVQRITV